MVRIIVKTLAFATTALAVLTVDNGQFSIQDSVGITSASKEFTSEAPSPLSSTTLKDGDVLKLSFSVKNDGEQIQPHQAMVSWSSSSDETKDLLSTVKVRKGGKGRWELDISRSPIHLLSLPTPLSLTLLIGHPTVPKPLSIPLGSFTFAQSLTQSLSPETQTPPPSTSWESERYAVMPEIRWTNRPKEKQPRAFLALAGVGAVLAPWVVFAGILLHLSLPLSFGAPSSLGFLASFLSFEVLLWRYWLSSTMKLIPTLPYFFGIAFVVAYTGRSALGVLKRKRERQEGKKRE
ncbi:hypothetical protein T439DRAFT_326336 [Meredithblackwellia eburnea MCA 4105]